MPKYAVDFFAEIQEVTSTTTNVDETNNLSDDLITSNYPDPYFIPQGSQTKPTLYQNNNNDISLIKPELYNNSFPTKQLSQVNNSLSKNVADALMGNAQHCCCFQRFPAGCQTHRHVVVSRGIQCNESNIKKAVPSCSSAVVSLCAPVNAYNDIFGNGDDNTNFPQSNFDNSHDLYQFKNNINCSNSECVKKVPEIFTPITQDPPELRDSSKFSRKNIFSDFKKCRKFFEDDIDSLSATISNYSFHEKFLKFESKNQLENRKEKIYSHNFVATQHQTPQPKLESFKGMDRSCNVSNSLNFQTPTPKTRQTDWRGSTEAIRGSTTKTLTLKSNDFQSMKNEANETPNSESTSSFGQIKDVKSSNMISNSGENTLVSNIDPLMKVKESLNNSYQNFERFPTGKTLSNKPMQSPQTNRTKSVSSTFDKKKSNNCSEIEKIVKNHDAKNANVVTFMRGSEELKISEDIKTGETDNLNELRKKQKFLMRHSRSNSKQSGSLNANSSPILIADSNTNFLPNNNGIHSSPENNPFTKSPKPNITLETSRPVSVSRNSNYSEGGYITPNTKVKRSVSFDKRRLNEPQHGSIEIGDKIHSTPFGEVPSQSCSRNSVRAKYCSTKVIKQRFYIPESANIEQILRDPSDRRIKAICDRHNCDIEIYSKVPKSGFLKNIIILAAPNVDSLRKCVRSLDCSMHWCLTAQLN